MRSTLVLLAAIVALLAGGSEGKEYERCELARELKNRYGMDRVADWVCLAYGESRYKTDAKGGPNSDGSYDFGIFQINNRYWCSPGQYNICGITCQSLLDDDISNDVTCAKLIESQQGFQAWTAWRNGCQGDVSGWTAGCF